MKYYSQYRSHDLFELQESLSGLSKSNRWVKLADHLPWGKIEKEYNKRLRNSHNGASIVSGYTYVDHVSWDTYNESSNLGMQLELYKKRFGMLPKEIQADKIYLGKENRKHIKSCHINCYNRPLGRPPKEENVTHAEDKKRAIGEQNEIEGTFGTTKRVYRANDIRAKLDQTADTWIGACFFAKNIMKFLRGLLCLILEKSGLKTFQKRIMSIFDSMEAVLPTPQGCMKEIN